MKALNKPHTTKDWILSTVITAVISAVTIVCLSKFLDNVFPSLFVLHERSNVASSGRMYSFEYSSNSPGKRFLGIVTQWPIWYYAFSLGNASPEKTGTIHVSIDFPDKMKRIWSLRGKIGITASNSSTIHFQVPQLAPYRGLTFPVAIASLDLPDINKIRILVTSSAGDFEKVPSLHYKARFKTMAE